MDWKSALKPKTSNIITTIVVAFVVFIITSLFEINIGGAVYFDFPFRIKQLSCGSAAGAAQSCTYPWILSGIIFSDFF